MATVVRMPQVAAGATEAAVQTWLVAEGDAVERGQSIAEIETEKAVFEHEAEASGVIARLLVAPGVAVAVGAPIALLVEAGESIDDAVAAAGIAPAVPADRLFASPLVRRLAREHGIALDAITGSGPNGRIVRRDLEAALDAGHAASARVTHDAPEAEFSDIPHTPMRRAIARRLTESITRVPQFVVSADCRVDPLLALRAEINADRDAALSLNDFVVKAVARALTDVPEANAIWTDEAVRRFSHADVGVAVAVEGGLVTPVVCGVDALPLGELSSRLLDVVERARAGRLTQAELEGGSFAVSNLGMFGTREFTAIINPPHSGILAVGAAQRRAVATDDGGIEAATVMTLNLTADHRVLDGALAAQLLAAIVRRLERPAAMLV